MKLIYFTFFLLLSLSSKSSEPELLKNIFVNAANSFQGHKAYFHLSAAAVTPLLIQTKTDAKIHNYFDEDSTDIYKPGEIFGATAPLLLISPLYLYGRSASDNEALGAAYALTQTTIITLTYISVLKALTGRPPPENDSPVPAQEQSEKFKFGFSRSGIVWGWPSGHMGVTTALAATLTNYYPEKLWVKIAGYSTAAYMLLTVSANNNGQMHWFSDGVAGALMGYAIGSTVGQDFRSRQNKKMESEQSYALLPLFGKEGSGVQVVWLF